MKKMDKKQIHAFTLICWNALNAFNRMKYNSILLQKDRATGEYNKIVWWWIMPQSKSLEAKPKKKEKKEKNGNNSSENKQKKKSKKDQF